jgi:hypothetical protein
MRIDDLKKRHVCSQGRFGDDSDQMQHNAL